MNSYSNIAKLVIGLAAVSIPVTVGISTVLLVKATDYSSTDFILRDPVVSVEGGRATSTDFEIFSSSGQLAIGEATSTDFTARAGFLYFHVITAPTLTASAGDGSVSLTWTAAQEPLGKLTNSYTVGQATISGGPYTFTDVGNATSSNRTGLTNDTTYYFVVQARDAASQSLATSTQVSAIPAAPAAPAAGGGGGGGGGTTIVPGTAVANFSGRAYPQSSVTLLKDAQIAAVSVAGPDSNFQINLAGLSPGSYIFGIYGTDNKGNRSPALTFPITLTANVTTYISGIFIAPTISVDKSEVRKGDTIAIFGQSAPSTAVTIGVNSPDEIFKVTPSDASGAYLYNFDTVVLVLGQHSARSKATIKNEISPFSKSIGFTVGTKNVFAEVSTACPQKADLNGDCRVNLVDFSIAAFWYKRTLTGDFIRTLETTKLNGDGKVDLIDFSIMAYHWTG